MRFSISRSASRSAFWAALALAVLLAFGLPARAAERPDPTEAWNPQIAEASARFGLPEHWIREVMRRESNGRPAAISWTGAIGLMQLMPGTYRDMRRRYGLGPDPYDPRDNILAGAAYLREMYDQYGSPGFLAAYNAGPVRAASYLAGGGLPGETVAYLSHLARRLGLWTGLLPAPAAPPAAYRGTVEAAGTSTGVSYGSAADGTRHMASLERASTAPITVPAIRWANGGRPSLRSSAPAYAPVADSAPAPRLVLAMATARRVHASPRPVPASIPLPPPDAALPAETFDAVYRMPQSAPDPAAIPAGATVGAYGDWGIEIGAYPDRDEAREAAARVAAFLLRRGAGAQPVVTPAEEEGRMSYRAELVGLDGTQAVAACNDLVRQDRHCLAIPPKS